MLRHTTRLRKGRRHGFREIRPRSQAKNACCHTLAGQAGESAIIMEIQSPTGKLAVETPYLIWEQTPA